MPPKQSVTKELRAIEKSFRQLATGFKRLEPILAGLSKRATATNKGAERRKPELTPKRRAALKLQGQYMGTLRGLPARKQAQVKKIRAEKGMKAAVAAAKRLSS